MKKTIRVKSYKRKGYCVKNPIKVKSHTRTVERKKASTGRRSSPLKKKR